MLRSAEYGPVRFFSLARSVAGRYYLSAGVYFVDGLLIDTGPPNAPVEFASIMGQVDADQIVLTHHHEDHTGNAAFASRHIDRPPLAHPLTLPLVRNPGNVPLYRRVVWGTPEPFETKPLGAGLSTAQYSFQVLHTPGHAPDHIVLYEPDQRWLFGGDVFLATRLKVLRSDENITEIIQSLRTLMELPDCTLFCQHSGMHESHQDRIGKKLDFLLGLQQQVVVMHDEGRTVAEIVRELKIEKHWWKLTSRGELCARNLIEQLLRDAAAEAA